MAQVSEKTVFTFTWRIENYSMCPLKTGQFLKSPEFIVNSLGETTWYLMLYPRGRDASIDDYVSCYLVRTASKEEEPEEVTISFGIMPVKSGMNLININMLEKTFKDKVMVGYPEFLARDSIFFPNDTLTLTCAMRSRKESAENTEGRVADSSLQHTYPIEEFCTFISDIDVAKNYCEEHSAYTSRIPVERRQLTWVIKDFKTQIQALKKIPASIASNLREKSELFLTCFLSDDRNNESNVRVDIQRKDGDFEQMFVVCKVSVLDSKGTARECDEDDHYFGGDYEVWSFPPVVEMSTLENPKFDLLDGGVLTLRFEFLISYPIKEVTIHCSSRQRSKAICADSWQQDRIKMYKNNELSDVSLIAEDTKISAHKLIICSRSPVFKAMFTGDTEENRTGFVHITDIDVDTLRKMVDFMYDDVFPELQLEDVMKLYICADKYQFLTLRKQCADFLKYNLSSSNVCDILVLADNNQDLDIMEFIFNFLKCHSKEVFSLNDWIELMKDSLQLAATMMHRVLT